MKQERLTLDILTEYNKHRVMAGKFEDAIINRITYILETWFQAFGSQLRNWYFCDAAEGERGDLSRHIDESSTTFRHMDESYIRSIMISTTKFKPNDDRYGGGDLSIIDRNGKEFRWSGEIPTRWLTEDFEQEITDGKVCFDMKQKAKKAIENQKLLQSKEEAKKEEAKKLVASAKRKLTKEELAALKSIR